MPDVVKPFTVLDTKKEVDGSQGVTFTITKTHFMGDATNKTVKMTTYISVPEGDNVDTFLFTYLSEGGWL